MAVDSMTNEARSTHGHGRRPPAPDWAASRSIICHYSAPSFSAALRPVRVAYHRRDARPREGQGRGITSPSSPLSPRSHFPQTLPVCSFVPDHNQVFDEGPGRLQEVAALAKAKADEVDEKYKVGEKAAEKRASISEQVGAKAKEFDEK